MTNKKYDSSKIARVKLQPLFKYQGVNMVTNIQKFLSTVSNSSAQKISLDQFRRADLLELLACNLQEEPDDTAQSNQYFQILVVELTEHGSSLNPSNIRTKLVTKRKKHFNDFPVINYNFEKKKWERDKTISARLPAKGVIVKEGFLPIRNADSPQQYFENLGKYPTVRFLLQTRKLSQLMAKTWLPKNYFNTHWEKDQVLCTREIFLSTNLKPDKFDPGWDEIPTSGSDSDYIIKPDSLSQEGIRLSLLLTGQAYLWVPQGKYSNEIAGYLPICPSIFSTYEIIYEYAWKLSWDTFYATRVDLAQPGVNARPPYYEVTLGYPPKPPIDEFTTLTDSKIEAWVNASDEDNGDTPFPFYPRKNDDGEYETDTVRYVIPPYPYIPMSCS